MPNDNENHFLFNNIPETIVVWFANKESAPQGYTLKLTDDGKLVVCFSVFYSLWQTPYALRFRLLFVALFVTLSLQSLCYRHACMPAVCFRQGDVFHVEVDYAGLALQLNGDSVLSWLQNTSSVLSPSSLDEPAIPAHRQRLSPSAHKRIILRHVFSA
ncbi:hypothetical protein Peur_034827 [Populus x canadensis]